MVPNFGLIRLHFLDIFYVSCVEVSKENDLAKILALTLEVDQGNVSVTKDTIYYDLEVILGGSRPQRPPRGRPEVDPAAGSTDTLSAARF